MDENYQYCSPEIWGGIECTINRIDSTFRDQLECSGHYTRTGDIEQFAALGIKKLRYPILWEHHETKKHGTPDWSWTRKQLETIRANNITPIAGLLHHGSGPAFTNLLDPAFPKQLAAYAAKVATEFPWLEYYTPVNEPLTTARFSGLYGLWYPHHKDEKSFVRMLLNQAKAIILSMQAIRKINSAAKLVQTEDLAKTHSTPKLSYQAEFENKRRWLTYDLLCGKFSKKHYFWNYFLRLGIDKNELEFFVHNNCPPNVIGFNYYVTSERYLDDNTSKYPACLHGGNGRHRYVDTEAVRASRPSGLKVLLQEAWKRYHLPIAITESHLSCTREEQLRWLKETWDCCRELKKENVDIRAVTVWSLLGAYDWNSLLTQANMHYESGVFDVRNSRLRPTSLARMVKALAEQGDYKHPLVEQKGWWSRDTSATEQTLIQKTPPVLIIGKNGTLGSAFSRICNHRGIPHIAVSRNELDIRNEKNIEQAIEQYRPWAIINAAGYVRVDDAELNRDECFALNTVAPALIANLCQQHGIRFMTFSSDLVFNGEKKSPYHEKDTVEPLNVYGASKAEAENRSLLACPESLVIRTSAFFGPWDQYNFVYAVLDSLKHEKDFHMPHDVMVSPTYVPDLANTALDLFIDEEKGIWHLTNDGQLTWADFATAIADRTNYRKKGLVAKSLNEMGWKAKRPLYSALESEKGIKMPSFDNALERYFGERVV
jgi:dTDP-4-dehydrorhamnose reductase